jgi:hypothetical protein
MFKINISGHVLIKVYGRGLMLNIKLDIKDKFCGLLLRFKFKLNDYD